MKQLFEFEQFFMYLLSIWLMICITSIVYSGIKVRRRELSISIHKQAVKTSAWSFAIIILIIEFLIVPQIGHHLTPLLKIHLRFCAALVISGALACIFNGKKWSGHWILGRLTFLLGIAVVMTGVMVTCYLHFPG